MKQILKNIGVIAALAFVCAPVGALAATRLAVQDSGGTDKMVVTDTGTIGVGTTSPVGGIHVKSGTYPNNTIKAEGNEVSLGGGFLAYHVKSNATLPVAGDRLGFMFFGSLNGVTPLHGAGISAKAEGAWTAANAPAAFAFETTAATGLSRIERFRVSSNGNVGVGDFSVTAPSQKLEVLGGVRLNTSTARPTCDANVRGTVWFTKSAAGTADILAVCAKDAAEAYAWKALF